MSQETSKWLNTMTLIGFTEKRGNAWHYRASEQGVEANHYTGAIPVSDVRRRLFSDDYIETPVTFEVGGKTYVDASSKHIVRVTPTDAFRLGTFKQGYQIHDYDQWLVRNVESILDDSANDGLQIGSAGLLKNGAVAWVQFETEETHEVAGVKFRPFLTAATSLDGSLATTYNRGAQIVVCDNTLSAALGSRDALQVKVRHSSKSLGALTEIRDALGVVFDTAEDVMGEIFALTNESVSDKVWAKFLDEVAKVDGKTGRAATLATNKREALQNLWAHDERVAPWAGTAYGVVAAMNTFDQHLANVRGMSRPERNALNMVKGEVDKTDAETLVTLRKVLAAA